MFTLVEWWERAVAVDITYGHIVMDAISSPNCCTREVGLSEYRALLPCVIEYCETRLLFL